jgi:hypothetical protein
MLNLELGAVIDWLTAALPACPDETWPPPVRPLELDGDAPALLTELGQALEAFSDQQLDLLGRHLRADPLAGHLRDVLTQMGAARQCRILDWLGERGLIDSPLIAAALVSGDSPEATSLRAAIRACARRALLSRLFAPDRLAALHSATETALQGNA